MAKLSELIKCLEDGGQIRRVEHGIEYIWFNEASLTAVRIKAMLDCLDQYEMRAAPPLPKEVTFEVWMARCDIVHYVEGIIDMTPQEDTYHDTRVEITIKEIL